MENKLFLAIGIAAIALVAVAALTLTTAASAEQRGILVLPNQICSTPGEDHTEASGQVANACYN
jgi:hypothetical protein